MCVCSRRNWNFPTVDFPVFISYLFPHTLDVHYLSLVFQYLEAQCPQCSQLHLQAAFILFGFSSSQMSLIGQVAGTNATLFKSLQVITCINLQSSDGICLLKTLFPFCQALYCLNQSCSVIVLPLLRLICSLDLYGNVVHAENVTAQTCANVWVE